MRFFAFCVKHDVIGFVVKRFVVPLGSLNSTYRTHTRALLNENCCLDVPNAMPAGHTGSFTLKMFCRYHLKNVVRAPYGL